MADWKETHANDSAKALNHPLCVGVREELMTNLASCCGVRKDDALVLYGLKKVQMYAAQVARAQALGFDPELLRATADEANRDMMKMAEALVKAGKPVTIVVPAKESP